MSSPNRIKRCFYSEQTTVYFRDKTRAELGNGLVIRDNSNYLSFYAVQKAQDKGWWQLEPLYQLILADVLKITYYDNDYFRTVEF